MTPDERNAAIEATATERAATLNPPSAVVHLTLADLHERVTKLEAKQAAYESAGVEPSEEKVNG